MSLRTPLELRDAADALAQLANLIEEANLSPRDVAAAIEAACRGKTALLGAEAQSNLAELHRCPTESAQFAAGLHRESAALRERAALAVAAN
ncbi:MAG: hypothetical protein KDA41_05385 [Planctomycetales bacterium]|nr:hypothetical protein [Planctomycetales bacterium]